MWLQTSDRTELLVYDCKADTWATNLHERGLCVDFELPASTSVVVLAKLMLDAMHDHPTQLQLRWAIHLLHEHEQVPFQLLGLRNKGQPRKLKNSALGKHIGLVPHSLTATQTIQTLLDAKKLFGHRKYCMSSSNQFIVRFGEPNAIIVLTWLTKLNQWRRRPLLLFFRTPMGSYPGPTHASQANYITSLLLIARLRARLKAPHFLCARDAT